MHRHFVRVLFLASLTLIACGEDDSQTLAPPHDNGIHGTMTAMIKGQQRIMTIVSLSAEPGQARSGLFTIEARTRDATIWMKLAYVTGAGSYPLGVNTDTNAGGMVNVMTRDEDDKPVYLSTAAMSGKVLVNTLTESRIAGTFNFSATSILSDMEFDASNGVLDITVDRGLPALPTGVPNSGSLRIDGIDCTASSVIGSAVENGKFELEVACGWDMQVWVRPRTAIEAPGNYEVPADVDLSAFRDGELFASVDGPPTGFLNVLAIDEHRVVATFGGTLTLDGGEGTITIQLGSVNTSVE